MFAGSLVGQELSGAHEKTEWLETRRAGQSVTAEWRAISGPDVSLPISAQLDSRATATGTVRITYRSTGDFTQRSGGTGGELASDITVDVSIDVTFRNMMQYYHAPKVGVHLYTTSGLCIVTTPTSDRITQSEMKLSISGRCEKATAYRMDDGALGRFVADVQVWRRFVDNSYATNTGDFMYTLRSDYRLGMPECSPESFSAGKPGERRVTKPCDSLAIIPSSIVPTPGVIVAKARNAVFGALVKYRLETRDQARVRLRITPKWTSPLPPLLSYTSHQLTKGETNQTGFQFEPLIPIDADKLELVAEMFDGDTILVQTQPVIYSTGDDFVSLNKIDPVEDWEETLLPPGSTQDFEADVTFKLAFSQRGYLLLRLFEWPSGKLLASSPYDASARIERSSTTQTAHLSIKQALIDVKDRGAVAVKAVILNDDGSRVLSESRQVDYAVGYPPTEITKVTLERYEGAYLSDGPVDPSKWQTISGGKDQVRLRGGAFPPFRVRIEYNGFDPASELKLLVVERPAQTGGPTNAPDRTTFIPGPAVKTGKGQVAYIHLSHYDPSAAQLETTTFTPQIKTSSETVQGSPVALEFEWVRIVRQRPAYGTTLMPAAIYDTDFTGWFDFSVRHRFFQPVKCKYAAEGLVVYERGNQRSATPYDESTIAGSTVDLPSFRFGFAMYADKERRRVPAVSFTLKFFVLCGDHYFDLDRSYTYPLTFRESPEAGASRVDTAGATLTNILGTIQQITSSKQPADPRLLVPPASSGGKGQTEAGSLALASMITAGSVWELKAAPRPAQFSADLTLRYDTADLPDDAAFEESKLQIVGFDPESGLVQAHDTTVDTENKTATAHISNLDPFYTLATLRAPAPVADIAPLRTSTHTSLLEFINPSAGDLTARITAFGPGGIRLPAEVVANPVEHKLTTGQALAVTPADLFGMDQFPAGYLKVESDGGAVLTAAGLTGLSTAAGLPVEEPAYSRLILPDAGVSGGFRADVHVTNTSAFIAAVTFELRASNGSMVETATLAINPRAQVTAPLIAMFADMPDPFSGYLVVTSNRKIVVRLTRSTESSFVAASAQPAIGAARLHIPYFTSGPGAVFTRVTVVNLSSEATTIRVTGSGRSGTLPLAAGEQSQFEPAKVLALDPETAATGGLMLESDAAPVAGEVWYGDPAGTADAAVWAIESAPAREFVVPLRTACAGAPARAFIQNAGEAPANLNLTAFGSDGSILASQDNQTVSAGSQAVAKVSDLTEAADAAYMTISSDQPVWVFAMSGNEKCLLVLPVLKASVTRPAPPSEPVLEVEPASLDFGSVPTDQTKEMTVTISNAGSAELTVNDIRTGSDAFRLGEVSLPLKIKPGGQQAIVVVFGPPAAGPRSGTLTIESDDPDRPLAAIPLSGAGASPSPPSIVAEPNPLDFGNVKVGESKTLTLTVRNAGGANLQVTAIRADAIACSVTSPALPLEVAPGLSVALDVTFSPMRTGPSIGLLTIANNDPDQPAYNVNLTGTGTSGAGTPLITVSPSPSLDFGTVSVGQTRDAQLLISNLGSGPLTVSSVSSSAGVFTVPGFERFTLNPGTFKIVGVRFTPTSSGVHTSTLIVASDDPAKPEVRITLTGVATGGAAAGCTYSLALLPAASAAMFPPFGGSGQIDVSVNAGACVWNVNVEGSWIHIAEAQSAGNGRLVYVVDPNFSSTARSGKITIGDKTVTITQQGLD